MCSVGYYQTFSKHDLGLTLAYLQQSQTWKNTSSVAIVDFDLKVQSTLTTLNLRGQCHLVTLPKRLLEMKILSNFS